MQPAYFITGTDTGIGKTVLTALLARYLRQRGVPVAALKPLCSGGRADARLLHAALDGALTLDEINPWHFRAAVAPAVAAKLERKRVTLAAVLARLRATRRKFAVTLVEGAGGLLSPLGENFNSLDLIIALRTAPIVVAPNKLGTVNHILLTLAALPKNLRRRAQVVLMMPAKPDAATAHNARLLGSFFLPDQIFTLPWLGQRPSSEAALKIARVKRPLKALCSR